MEIRKIGKKGYKSFQKRFKSKTQKKAVSPVVATVLLVMIVIILAIIILLWARGFIKEKVLKFDDPIGVKCGETTIKTFVNDDNTFGFTNTGNIPIYKVDVKTTKKGVSDIDNVDFGNGIDIGLSTLVGTIPSDAEKIEIIPVLLGQTKDGEIKEYTCKPEERIFVVWEA